MDFKVQGLGFKVKTLNPPNNVLEMKTLKWQDGDNIDIHNTWKW